MAFDVFPDGKPPPVHYHKSSERLIFDVRVTLERKARWLKDLNKTPKH